MANAKEYLYAGLISMFNVDDETYSECHFLSPDLECSRRYDDPTVILPPEVFQKMFNGKIVTVRYGFGNGKTPITEHVAIVGTVDAKLEAHHDEDGNFIYTEQRLFVGDINFLEIIADHSGRFMTMTVFVQE